MKKKIFINTTFYVKKRLLNILEDTASELNTTTDEVVSQIILFFRKLNKNQFVKNQHEEGIEADAEAQQRQPAPHAHQPGKGDQE